MTFPVVKVTMPSDLAGQENGKLDSKLLMPVGSGQLHHLAARAFGALYVYTLHFHGVHLTATYGGWYRSYKNQETLFRQRYDPEGTGGGCKTWNGVKWCKKSSKLATAATPGTSNHGWGLAIDMAYDNDPSDGVGSDDATYIAGHPVFKWLLEFAIECGFSWELQSEPWHIRYVAGDELPAKVLEWEAFVASLSGDAEPPVVAPPTVVTPDPGTTYNPPTSWGKYPGEVGKPKLSQTAPRTDQSKEYVRYLQDVLRLKCAQNVTTDGWFGPQTETAVRAVQKFFRLTIDGWVGPQTWGAIDLAALN